MYSAGLSHEETIDLDLYIATDFVDFMRIHIATVNGTNLENSYTVSEGLVPFSKFAVIIV